MQVKIVWRAFHSRVGNVYELLIPPRMHFPWEERGATCGATRKASLVFLKEYRSRSDYSSDGRLVSIRNVTATCIQGEHDLVNFTRMKGFSRPPFLGIIFDARNIYIYIFRWNLDIRFLIILSKFDPFRFLYALSSVDCVARIGSMQAFENYDFNRVRASLPPLPSVAFFSARIPASPWYYG